MSPSDLLTYGVIVIALLFGARGAVNRSTISALKEQNDAFERREKQRIIDKDRDDKTLADEQDRTKAALKRLGDRNEYLEELVLRRAEMTELVDVMQLHNSEAADRHAATIKALRDIRQDMAQRKGSEEQT